MTNIKFSKKKNQFLFLVSKNKILPTSKMTNSETLKFELRINDKERSYIRECSNNILL